MDTQQSTKGGSATQGGLVLRDGALIEYPYRDNAALAEYFGQPQRETPPPTLRDYLKVLFRQKGVILATVIAVMATVIVGLKMRTPVYEARVKMLILAEKQVESPYYRNLDDSFKTEMALTQSEIVKANPVLERTVRALKLDERPLDYEREFASPLKRAVIDAKTRTVKERIRSPQQEKFMRFKVALESLRSSVKVKPVSNTNLFTIAVRDYSPIAAATIANTVSRYYVIFDLEQQLAELQMKYGDKHLAVRQLRDHIQGMERVLTATPNSYIDAMGPASVKILEQAGLPTEPVGLPGSLIALAALATSLFLGVVLAFCFEAMDPTFRSPQDVERVLGMPMIGSVPRRSFGPRVIVKDPMMGTRYTEAFERLADQIHIILRSKGGLQTVLVTGCLRGEGASTVTFNLAHYLSRALGHKVLVIDANLRHPSAHKIFRIPNKSGLSELLEGRAEFETAVWELTPTLGVLPAGSSKLNPVTLIDSLEMGEVLRRARERYEVVLVDAPHVKGFKDAEILAGHADGVAIVVEAARTRRQAVKATLAPLEQRKANLLGVVLNKRAFALPKMIYERV